LNEGLAAKVSSGGLVDFLILLVCLSFVFFPELLLTFIFCREMARVKHTAKLVEGSETAGGANASAEAISFDFRPSKVTKDDLEVYAKLRWFFEGDARPPEGETMPAPRDDEVVVFREYFLAGLRFPMIPFVLGVLKKFGLRFHQLHEAFCFCVGLLASLKGLRWTWTLLFVLTVCTLDRVGLLLKG